MSGHDPDGPDIEGYERSTFTAHDKTRTIYRKGSGPAVIVMAEVPGITPKVIEFADRVAAIGCTAVLPHLFGDPGRDPDPKEVGQLNTLAYGMSTIVPACVSREFVVFATGRTSPVIDW